MRDLQAVGGATLSTPDARAESATHTGRPDGDGTGPATPLPPDISGKSRGRLPQVWFGLTVLAVLAVDLVSKILVVARLPDHPPIRLLGGALYLVLTRNSGAAFSLGQSYTWVITVIAAVVSVGILVYARRLRHGGWALALGLILGGALGNLIDRIFRSPGVFRGHVVDFLSFLDDHGGHFPVFNLADSALCCGVAVAILLEISGRRFDGRATGDAAADKAKP